MAFEEELPSFSSSDGSDLRVGIVASQYYQQLVDALLDSAEVNLLKNSVSKERMEVVRVPGAGDIPYAAYMMAATGEFDVILAIGVVLASDSLHHKVLAQTTADALQRHAVETEIPIVNGIVTADNHAQAQIQCGGGMDIGPRLAQAVVSMGNVNISLTDRIDQIDFELDQDLDDDESSKEGDSPEEK